MFSPLQGLRLGRRAVVIGIALAGTTATAVGAASGHTPWPEPARPSFATASDHPPSTDAPVITTEALPVEPTIDSTVPAPPATTAPVVTTAEIAPPTAAVVAPDPAPAEPVVTEPAVVEPPAEPAITEPPTTEPAPAPAPAPKPANDNVVPATLTLACAVAGENPAGPVSCSWSGTTPDGFASFVLLRADPDGKGRVPYRSSDAGASSFVDGSASAGNHSYVLVALDAAEHPLAHSNMVLIQIAAA